jgi:hypothetical protein
MPDAAELRARHDRSLGLKTDRRNTWRRDRYAELHPRYCRECGAKVRPRAQRCDWCIWHSLERYCRGWDGHPCEMVMESRKLRCASCEIFHLEWLNDRLNERRRLAYGRK